MATEHASEVTNPARSVWLQTSLAAAVMGCHVPLCWKPCWIELAQQGIKCRQLTRQLFKLRWRRRGEYTETMQR